jgi:hypothetical protein
VIFECRLHGCPILRNWGYMLPWPRYCEPAPQLSTELLGMLNERKLLGLTDIFWFRRREEEFSNFPLVGILYSSGTFAGSRHEAFSILPLQRKRHALTMVGYNPGTLPLPRVKLTAQRCPPPHLARRCMVSCSAYMLGVSKNFAPSCFHKTYAPKYICV